VVHEDKYEPLVSRPILSAVALDGSEPIAAARHSARHFMTEVQAVHGLPVSERAVGLVELVASGGAVKISVWDADPTLPAARPADPG
jgi:hypothetical protein